MTVIKHGIFPRVLVTAFAAYMIVVFFTDGIIKLQTWKDLWSILSAVWSILGAVCMTYFIAVRFLQDVWSTISFDSEGVRKQIPFRTDCTMKWSEITAYRNGFPSYALLGKGNDMAIQSMMPRIDVLWNECAARGIKRANA